MELFEKLTDLDKRYFQTYLDMYAGYDGHSEVAPLKHLLRFWNEKGNLFELLGHNLILEKEIEYTKTEDQLHDEMYKSLYGDKMNKFYWNFNKFVDYYTDKHPENRSCYNLRELVNLDTLTKNMYTGMTVKVETPDDKTITVAHGAKPTRILGKLAQAFDIEGFEEFRLEHSRVFNQRKTKGTLCLSMHPLDYITISDNDYNWESCMNWRHGGQYRMGTVEMMNSTTVLVAYLKGSEPFRFADCYWSNKKWRNLVIVTPDIITTIKGYPYQSSILDEQVIFWVKELAENNLGYNYWNHIIDVEPDDNDVYVQDSDEHGVYFNFETNIMYNDFGNGNIAHCVVKPGIKDNSNIWICYSGETECMCCGASLSGCIDDGELEDEGCVVGNCCINYEHCDHCGDRIPDGNYYELDGERLCRYCFEDLACEDPITGEVHHQNNMYTIYLSYSDEIDRWETPSVEIYDPEYRDDDLSDYFTGKFKEGYISNSIWHHRCIYVSPDECTKEGLKLFNATEADIEKLRNALVEG